MVCKVSNQSKSKHAGIQEFSSGLVQVHLTYKKLLQRFFGPQLILQKTNGYFHRKLSFSEVPEGIKHFSGGGGGGSNYFQGGGGGGPIAYLL